MALIRHMLASALRLGIMVISISGTRAFADDMPSGEKVHNDTLEEIVVTAEKREESSQTVPISLAVFTGLAAHQAAARGAVRPR